MPYLNVFLLAGCAAVYAASRLVEPVYLAQPGILLDSVSVLKPPGAATAAALGAFVFLAVWMMESMAYRFVLRLPWKQAQAESLRTYRPGTALARLDEDQRRLIRTAQDRDAARSEVPADRRATPPTCGISRGGSDPLSVFTGCTPASAASGAARG